MFLLIENQILDHEIDAQNESLLARLRAINSVDKSINRYYNSSHTNPFAFHHLVILVHSHLFGTSSKGVPHTTNSSTLGGCP